MRTLVCVVIYVLVVILAIPLILFCFVIGWRAPLLFVGKSAMALGRLVLGIRFDMSGQQTVDRKRSCIFMANHLSFLDGPLLFLVIPQYVRVIFKREIYRIPIIGWVMQFVGFVPVDRKGVQSGRKSIEHATRLVKEREYSYLIFPEGTRSRDGQMQPFRRGAFFLAINSQVPIVPITINGSYELMPKGNPFPKKGTVKIVFHKPVPVAGLTIEDMPGLMKKIRAIILSGLDGLQ
jgi:1-acyl-sn-glycerol-3-phosphate acyltransferase